MLLLRVECLTRFPARRQHLGQGHYTFVERRKEYHTFEPDGCQRVQAARVPTIGTARTGGKSFLHKYAFSVFPDVLEAIGIHVGSTSSFLRVYA